MLAAGIRDRAGGAPEALAGVTVLVPTRRARRSLSEAFLRQSDGQALLLPKMIALGDLDEDEILLSEDAGSFDVSEAVSGLRRQLLLTALILAKPSGASPDQAANLALELARLLDQVHTERLSFDGLSELVPEAFAEHWQETLEFLKILTEVWPGILEDEGDIDAADRRNRLFEAQAQAWQASPPSGPIIAAGSTGSIPATADLLGVVASLPQGELVLPGLDLDATPETWAALEEHHPQFGMAHLLDRLGVDRKDVSYWKAPGFKSEPSLRSSLFNAALIPAGQKAANALSRKKVEKALSGVFRLDCPSPREEAAVIALIMRRTLETPEKTCALMTPDRNLARRVAAELGRWNIDIDDSAGRPLARTPAGAFLLLTARMIADGLSPVSLLAALKHPLAAGGMSAGAFKARVRELEMNGLRGPRPGPGIDGLLAAVTTGEAGDFLKGLGKIFAPFGDRLSAGDSSFSDLLAAHVQMAEALAQTNEADGASILWAFDAGEAAAKFIAELRDAAQDLGPINAANYPALLETLMAGRAVRPRYGLHGRLHIWGLLEARLQQADVMILGGLNEAVWPPEAKASPWMSRPMMKRFGLPVPERRIGLAAHDFAQAFAAPEVVLTRSERIDGTPQVPSRWLLRLENLFEQHGVENAFAASEPWLQWVEALDKPTESRQVTEPRPTPPLDVRPRKLSVTQVEHLTRDPYAIYARHVLKLRPLDPLDAEPGAADRGIIIHDVLHEFLDQYGDTLPDDAERRLLEIGRKVFDQAHVPPGVNAFWWPRFERIAGWFIAYERDRRAAGFKTVATEESGAMEIPGPAGSFTLTARADRIDRRADIGLAMMDYKTGQAPSVKEVKAQFSPQLPLEAAIAQAGGFGKIGAEETAQLVYLELSGGRTPGEEKVLKLDVPEVVARALKGLKDMIAQYDDPAMPYLSQPRPKLLKWAGDYDHLARILEWRGKTGTGEAE